MKQLLVTCLFLMCAIVAVTAQDTYPYNGIRPKDVTADAFVHATIWVDDQTKLEDATLVIEKGVVIAVGPNAAIPPNAVVHDATGLIIYPSFIDLCSDYGMPKLQQPDYQPRPQLETNRKGAFGWNQAIRSDVSAASLFVPNDEMARELRGLGFGVVLTYQHDGIARGTSALVSLGGPAAIALLRPEAGAHYSFSKGTSTQEYPSSLMGSIALLRQTYYDARWYAAGGHKSERNLVLEAWNRNNRLPQFFEANGKWNNLRADRIGDEFGIQYIIKGGGDEYQRTQEMKESGAAFILPLNFPAAFDVSDPDLARMVSLTEMKHWELAPSNAVFMRDAGITFCFTAEGLEDRKEFMAALRKVHERGLTEAEILRALTSTPARLAGAETEVGGLKPGMRANFFLSTKSFLDKEAIITANWVNGEYYAVKGELPANLTGSWKLETDRGVSELLVTGKPGNYEASVELTSSAGKKDKRKATLTQDQAHVTLVIDADSAGTDGKARLTGIWNGSVLTGRGQSADGRWFEWRALRSGDRSTKTDSTAIQPSGQQLAYGAVIYPFMSYGRVEMPEAETILIKNATIWTCEAEGIIENGQLLLSGGKIVAVGKDLNVSGYASVVVIDAEGKHVTPGIIDEHSHIALESVNEGTQASSAEVQEASVIDPEDINIYRQLSGGVTAAQLLHGSANPIGGQSALVKMRWGSDDQEMLIDGTDGFIKFALGENVKQSNWGDYNTVRFPQTRMGVEQVYYDHFIRAREYGELWKKYELNMVSRKKGKPLPEEPRRDLELDALLEILEHKRFITCHSYVQSEINMLMHVADSLGFRINTFTHILEGYKIADKMREHGAGGSSFSDWWAYKMEVKDAIPYNGALLWENGVTVAFNSDDAEMARRLNQEAAKAMKYGGVPPEEALKFVTLNPAKLLHLDQRMGSLKVGKDADLVIWSDYPLSMYARAEKTFVDGICLYDREEDARMQEWISLERARLIQRMLDAKAKGEPIQQPVFRARRHFHCDSLGDR